VICFILAVMKHVKAGKGQGGSPWWPWSG